VSTSSTIRYRFDQFELQPGERRLLAAGTQVALAPRAFNLLVALVEHEGRLASKEYLLEQVWPGVVVEENALHAQISALRKVLGADAITTVSGAGYRFALGLVRPDGGSASTQAAPLRHNLPKALTSFIGREQQITELKGLLRQTPLLTLSGAGGCGKTRLAIELAGQVLEGYADGIWLVELAALAERDLISQTVAGVLGLKERAGETFTQTVSGYLAAKHLLLILDNVEHLLAPCAELAQTLLQRCGQLSILVTSREQLGVSGELTYRVPSLSLPDTTQKHVAEMLAAYESTRLFIERARLQHLHFSVTAQNAPAIASICAHLDGIPLAIELAAARVRAMSVEELNDRLDQRFSLLTDRSTTTLPRHRTLRAMIDWSYELLSDAEKAVFCRASVFAGGFTLEAATKVLSSGAVDEIAVLDALTSLTDKSLLQAEEHAGRTRYRQLETVRQYGRDRLRESGDEPAWEGRHRDHFLSVVEANEEGLRLGDRQAGLERLEAEIENLRVALASALGRADDYLAGLRLAAALSSFWWYSGIYWSEGRAWLTRFLDVVPAGEADPARAKALSAAGELAHHQSDLQSARSLLEEGIALQRKLGDRRGLAVALADLGPTYDTAGDWVTARALLEESLAITREFEDPWLTARVLFFLVCVVLHQGDIGTARVLAQELADVARPLGGHVLANGLNTMAEIELEGGDADAAATLNREALAMSTADRITARNLLDTAARTACALGKSIRAAVVWGQVERLEQDIRMSLTGTDRLSRERNVASARAALGDDAAFDAAWRRGSAMSTEQVTELVLCPDDP
jgi:non-specific serine/threonine protein kinase